MNLWRDQKNKNKKIKYFKNACLVGKFFPSEISRKTQLRESVKSSKYLINFYVEVALYNFFLLLHKNTQAEMGKGSFSIASKLMLLSIRLGRTIQFSPSVLG